LTLIGTRFSYQDYDAFYEQTFLPLKISNEELLNIPPVIEQEPEDPDGPELPDNQENPEPPANNNVFDFDPDFW
ncbi:MAG: hypothetical protein K2G91_11105, partial [Prevotella sp.]|nr:hypothetical protein [Prevotella sp.]